MGLTCENLHIFVPSGNPLDLDQVAGVIRDDLEKQGLAEDPDGADRVVALTKAPDIRWVSVFDSEFGNLDRMLARLSAALVTPVVGLSVVDSDRFTCVLYRDGLRVDVLEGEALKRRGSGDPSRWLDVVVTQDQEATLRSGISGPFTFAEEGASKVLQALGLDPAKILQPSQAVHQQPPANAKILRFRETGIPHQPAERRLLVLVNSGSNPGVLGRHSPTLMFQVANRGRQSKGLWVSLSGPAANASFIQPQILQLYRVVNAQGGGYMSSTTPYQLTRTESGYAVELPELEMPTQEDLTKIPVGAAWLRAFRKANNVLATFHVLCATEGLGESTLTVQVGWLGEPDASISVTLPVAVRAEP